MQINKNNYEAYFLDFWENSLDVKAREDLSRFLEENPGLHDEFLDFRDAARVKLSPDEELEFSGKTHLKKPVIIPARRVNAENFENFIIAKLEGDLSDDELQELEEFRVKNPHLVPEFQLYSQTILRPDQGITFAGKARLKMHVIPNRVIRVTARFASVAAAILLFALIMVDPFGDSQRDEEFAALTVERKIPVKPLPVFGPEDAAGKLDAVHPVLEPGYSEPAKRSVEMYAQSKNYEAGQNTAIPEAMASGNGDFAIALSVPERLEPKSEIALLSTNPLQKDYIGLRTDLAPAFDDGSLQDAGRGESNEKEQGAFGRFLANLVNQILGNGEEVVESSLMGQIAGMGRERIDEIRENAPKIETVQTEDSRKTYLTINENFRIRISKGQKPGE